MSLAHLAIRKTDDLPLRHAGNVHNGKVRSVYWLSPEDSRRIVQQHNYAVPEDTPLGVMVISDRISAYEIIWQGEDGLMGVPGKGASLNATAEHWFKEFEKAGLAGNHILETPHPLVWIVRRARPIMVEAIARQYITGSMWRAYEKGDTGNLRHQAAGGSEERRQVAGVAHHPVHKGHSHRYPRRARGRRRKRDPSPDRRQLRGVRLRDAG